MDILACGQLGGGGALGRVGGPITVFVRVLGPALREDVGALGRHVAGVRAGGRVLMDEDVKKPVVFWRAVMDEQGAAVHGSAGLATVLVATTDGRPAPPPPRFLPAHRRPAAPHDDGSHARVSPGSALASHVIIAMPGRWTARSRVVGGRSFLGWKVTCARLTLLPRRAVTCGGPTMPRSPRGHVSPAPPRVDAPCPTAQFGVQLRLPLFSLCRPNETRRSLVAFQRMQRIPIVVMLTLTHSTRQTPDPRWRPAC